MAGQNTRQPRITLTKSQDKLHNQTQSCRGLFFVIQDQIDAGNQTLFDKLNQTVKHPCFTGEVAVEGRLGNAYVSGQPGGGNSLGAIP